MAPMVSVLKCFREEALVPPDAMAAVLEMTVVSCHDPRLKPRTRKLN